MNCTQPIASELPSQVQSYDFVVPIYRFPAVHSTVPDLIFLKDWAITIAGLIAVVTFLTGFLEYARRGRQERAQNFVQMRRRFLETPQHREILELLQAKDKEIRNISIQEKRNFVGFFEEVALMVNSKLIKRSVAHYMFGYYVLLTSDSEDFWVGLDRESEYWTVFRQFAEQMTACRSNPETFQKELAF